MSVINRQKQVKVPIGMRRSWWAPHASEPANALPTFGTVQDMGAARLGTLTINVISGTIEGDDEVLVPVEKFVSAQLVAETTVDDLQLNATVFGRTYSAGVEHSKDSDSCPFGGYAYIEPLMKQDKSVVYRATFLTKVQALLANDTQPAATRQSGQLSPAYRSITYSAMCCNTGDWRLRQEFTTEAAAETWIMGLFGGTTAWPISVTVVGPGTVTPSGVTYVTAGQNLTLEFSAAPAAVYDNGTAISVTGTSYTFSSVSAAHDVVAIFSAS